MILNSETKRPAIAMIELIFAIVVIGIVLMSAPTLVQQATRSGYVAIQQEAINEVASQVNMIMGYHWDENDANELYLAPILQVNAGNTGLNEANISGELTGRRLGTPEESMRTFVRADGQRFGASTLGSDGSDRDDIDDFIGITNLTFIEADIVDYGENVETTTIDINTSIAYITDDVGGGTYQDPGADKGITFVPSFTSAGTTSSTSSTNIKRIKVTLTNPDGPEELDKEIVFNAFSCNIGAYNLEEKEF